MTVLFDTESDRTLDLETVRDQDLYSPEGA